MNTRIQAVQGKNPLPLGMGSVKEKQNEYSSFQTEVGGVENSRRRDAQSGIRNILSSPEIK